MSSNSQEKLIERWGTGIELNQCWAQKRLNFISEEARLNILFNPVTDKSQYIDFFKTVNADRLLMFYRQYNGCKLFSNSLCIYGLCNASLDLYQVYDLRRENERLKHNLYAGHYLFFGSLGGQFLFAFKAESNDEKVYCINVDDGYVIKCFKNFDILFSKLLSGLYQEYDDDGKKIHKNSKYRKIKSLYNTTIERRFLEEE